MLMRRAALILFRKYFRCLESTKGSNHVILVHPVVTMVLQIAVGMRAN
jgi:hypothetical protein